MMDFIYDILDWLFDFISHFRKYIIIFLGVVAIFFITSLLLKHSGDNNSKENSQISNNTGLPKIAVSKSSGNNINEGVPPTVENDLSKIIVSQNKDDSLFKEPQVTNNDALPNDDIAQSVVEESTEELHSSIDDDLSRICVSMKVLEKQVLVALANGKSVPEECANLCELSYVEGYVINDSEDYKDVILVGLRSKNRPSLRLDDLILTMRSIKTSTYPYCSLDPLKENVKRSEELSRMYSPNSGMSAEEYFVQLKDAVGPQKVVIGGVPDNSRIAHVMIEADYHMKKVSQGHVIIPNVESCLDIAVKDEQSGSSRSRFWFHIDENSPTYDVDDGIVWLDQCKVIVLTKRQGYTVTGELVDIEVDDPVADTFAQQFSDQFPVVAQFVPFYADLENLYRLRALLLSMDLRNALSSIESDFNSYLPEYTYVDNEDMDPSYDGLANFRQQKVSIPSGFIITTNFISGGVSQEMQISPESFSSDNETLLKAITENTLSTRPDAETLWWYMN